MFILSTKQRRKMENKKPEQGRRNRMLVGAIVAGKDSRKKQGTNRDRNQRPTNPTCTFDQSEAELDTVYTAGDRQSRDTFDQWINRRLVAEETAKHQETRRYKKPTTRDAGFNQYVMESDSDSDEMARHQETEINMGPTTEVEQSTIYNPSHCHGQQFLAGAQQYPINFYPLMGQQFGAQFNQFGQRAFVAPVPQSIMIPIPGTTILMGPYPYTGQQFGAQVPNPFATSAQCDPANTFYNDLLGASEDIDEFQTPRRNMGRRRD